MFSTECIRHPIADICIFSIFQHLPWDPNQMHLHSKARPLSRWPRPGWGWNRRGSGQTKHLSTHPCHLPCCTCNQWHMKNQLGKHTPGRWLAGGFLHQSPTQTETLNTTPTIRKEAKHSYIITLTHLSSIKPFSSVVYNETGVLLLSYSSLEGTYPSFILQTNF